MTSDMDKLKTLFDRQGATPPGKAAKEAAIGAAMAAFDEDHAQKHAKKHKMARQGSRLMDRLTGAAIAARANLFGRRPMKLSHVLAGSASVLVLSLAVLNVSQFQTPGQQETGASEPAAKPNDTRLRSFARQRMPKTSPRMCVWRWCGKSRRFVATRCFLPGSTGW